LAASPVAPLLPVTISLAAGQALLRALAVGRHFGVLHGVLSVLRIPLANAINTTASARAAVQYWRGRIRREPIPWLKTAHQYPNRFALEPHRPALGEILVQSGYCSQERLTEAANAKPVGKPFGAWLVESGVIREEELYEAMSLQNCVPLEYVEPWDIPVAAVRALPLHVVGSLEVVPIRIDGPELVVAAPEAVDEAAQRDISRYTSLPVRVVLMTRSNFEAIRARCLTAGASIGNTPGRR
jgi:bacteriophage N4 adsorption protein B